MKTYVVSNGGYVHFIDDHDGEYDTKRVAVCGRTLVAKPYSRKTDSFRPRCSDCFSLPWG